MSDAAETARARIDAWVESAHRRAEQARAVQAELASRETWAESRDGLVRVTVDSHGVPTSLDIDDQALNGGGEALAATVLATMREAQARLTVEVSAVVGAHLGDGTPGAEAIVQSYRSRFGVPEERSR